MNWQDITTAIRRADEPSVGELIALLAALGSKVGEIDAWGASRTVDLIDAAATAAEQIRMPSLEEISAASHEYSKELDDDCCGLAS